METPEQEGEDVPTGGAPRKGDDEVFVAGFAAGLTTEAVAEAAGVSPRTARRRRSDPRIAQQVNIRRAEITNDTSGRLAALGTRAVDVLAECLEEGEPRDRLAAAKALLQIGPRFRADVEFEHRLLDLEGRLAGDRPDPQDPDPIWNGQEDE